MLFYLVKKNLDPDYPLDAAVGRSGRKEPGGQAYGIDAANDFPARRHRCVCGGERETVRPPLNPSRIARSTRLRDRNLRGAAACV